MSAPGGGAKFVGARRPSSLAGHAHKSPDGALVQAAAYGDCFVRCEVWLASLPWLGLEATVPLRTDDVRAMRSATPAEKAAQALDTMRAGIAWRRVAPRRRHPVDSEDELERHLDAWLFANE